MFSVAFGFTSASLGIELMHHVLLDRFWASTARPSSLRLDGQLGRRRATFSYEAQLVTWWDLDGLQNIPKRSEAWDPLPERCRREHNVRSRFMICYSAEGTSPEAMGAATAIRFSSIYKMATLPIQ